MKTNKFLVLGFVFLFSMSLVMAASMTRSVPSTAAPGSTIDVVYTASGTSGTWGASIVDVVSNGCTFPGGASEYKTVMLSTDGNSKTVSVTVPSSGSCTFSGDSKFGTNPIQNFPDKTLTISSNGDGDEAVCGDGTCNGDETETTCPGDCEVNGNGTPSFSFDTVLFTIGGFDVTILVALLIFGGLMVFSLIK